MLRPASRYFCWCVCFLLLAPVLLLSGCEEDGANWPLVDSSFVLGQEAETVKPLAASTSSSSVEVLGTIRATQPLNGLGFVIDAQNDWEFRTAAATGAKHIRMQCGWNGTESQTAPPNNTNTPVQFALQAGCQAGLKSAMKYGIHPTVLAAFGSPYHAILQVTLPSGAAVGTTSLDVEFASGVGGDTLASLRPFYDNIIAANNVYITGRHSYAGGLITGVVLRDETHATITLASAITMALPADTTTQYLINEGLYPPAATSSPVDPSVLAYAKYAQFLAAEIAASGNTGDVELWNEPPWFNDPWDNLSMFYDVFKASSPGPQQASLPNFGFAAALQAQTPPPGVTFVWAGTNKSGANSLLMSRMFANTGVYANNEPTVISSESFHPYGNSPEDALWTSSCLAATIRPYPAKPTSFSACNLAGTPGGNLSQAVQQTLVKQSINPAHGIGHSLTETGTSAGDNAHKARFVVRQFLGYQAVGITPVDFFKLYDKTSPYTFINPVANADGSHTPMPALTVLSGLMADLALIGNDPVAPVSETVLPSVVSYTGTYPLSTVQMIGSRAGDTANSIMMTIWQRSNVGGVMWATLAQPDAASVSVEVPAGMSIVAVKNLDTGEAVSYASSGRTLTLQVSDDPIEILLEPASQTSSTLTLKADAVSSVPGQRVTLTASMTAVNGTLPAGSITFLDGTSVLGTGDLVQGVARYSTTTLSPGLHMLSAQYAGDAMLASNTGSAQVTVTVAALDFTMSVVTVGSQGSAAGASSSYDFAIAPLYGVYPGTVVVSVTGLPSDVKYSLSPTTVAQTAGPQMVALNVQTSSLAAGKRSAPSIAPLLCGLFLLPLAAVRRWRLSTRGACAYLVLTLVTFGLIGCGSGGIAPVAGALSYNVTVTATSGGVQHSAVVVVRAR